ncbi:MAG: hypothetical protein GY863_07975, partial [bacterium]|nr:hypothetical protein [bacterium]
MKKKLFIFSCIVLFCFTLSNVFAQSKIANSTGNWSNTGTWQGGVVPAAGDTIFINSGITVTFDGGAVDSLVYGHLIFKGIGSQLMIATAGTTATGLTVGNVYVDSLSGYINIFSGDTLHSDTVYIDHDTLMISGSGVLDNTIMELDSIGIIVLDSVTTGNISFEDSSAILVLTDSVTAGSIDVVGGGKISLGGYKLTTDSLWVNQNVYFFITSGGILNNIYPMDLDIRSNFIIEDSVEVNGIDITDFTTIFLYSYTLTTDSIWLGADTLVLGGSGTLNNLAPIVADSFSVITLSSADIGLDDVDVVGRDVVINTSNNTSVARLKILSEKAYINTSSGVTFSADSIIISPYDTLVLNGQGTINNFTPIIIDSLAALVIDSTTAGDVVFNANNGELIIDNDAGLGYVSVASANDTGTIAFNANYTLTLDSIVANNNVVTIDGSGTIDNTGSISISGSSGTLQVDSVITTGQIKLINGAVLDVNDSLTVTGDVFIVDSATIEIAPGTEMDLDGNELTNVGSSVSAFLTFSETGTFDFNYGSLVLSKDMFFDGVLSGISFTTLDTIKAINNAILDFGVSTVLDSLSVIGGNGAGTTLTLKSDTARKYTFSGSVTTTGDLMLAGADTLLLTASPSLTLGSGFSFTLMDSVVFIDTLANSFIDSNGFFFDLRDNLVPHFVNDADTLNFDSVQVGYFDTLFFDVTNDSSDILNVDSVIYPASIFTVIPDSEYTIYQGDTVEFKVVFNPDSSGSFADSLLFYSNDTASAPFVLYVEGVGIDTLGNPYINLSPDTLNFDTVSTIDTDSMNFYVVNDSGGVLYIDSVVSSDSSFWVGAYDSSGVLAGDTLELSIFFQPADSIYYWDTLLVYSNDTLSSPDTVFLEGTGDMALPYLTLVDTVGYFSATLVDSTRDMAMITIRNHGTDTAN